MFTIDDLWKIMSFLKDGTTSSGLSELTTTLSTSEQGIVNNFFEQILDQDNFLSNDYKKLREMFIDWYSAHRTIATTQKFASDVHQLPNNHLSELFKSFGFPLGLDLVPLTSKANFFLDLVNFYKKKGTPETLVDVLDYYGFSDADLVEYWLQKDSYGNLIFRGDSVRQASTGSTLLLDTDISFEKMTGSDPHWMQSKEHIESLILTNTINLPSKTPYFSLTSIFSLYTINISLGLLFRVVKDQYDRYLLNKVIPYNIPVKNLGLVVPILHIFIASIYAFERMFGKGIATNYLNCNCYTGEVVYKGDPPIVTGLSDILKNYEDLIARPTSRLDMDTRLLQLKNEWSILNSDNFLNVADVSESLLIELNPTFKNLIDTWFDIGDQNYLITYLLGTLDNWIKLNINSKSPSLVIIMLGLGFREELDSIINFFKPYRARLAFMDTAFSIKNPLTESVLLDEWVLTQIESTYKDSIRPVSFPIDWCSSSKLSDPKNPDPLPLGFAGYHSNYRWDIGCYFDIPPIEQMDDVYFEKLQQLSLLSHEGSICDDVIYSINTSIYEQLTFDEDIKSDIHQFIKDTIPLSDSILLSEEISLHDNFGLEPPTQYDVGFSFDSLHNRSIVRDDFHIDISSFGFVGIKSNVSGSLSFGSIESLSFSPKPPIIYEQIDSIYRGLWRPIYIGAWEGYTYYQNPTASVTGTLSFGQPEELSSTQIRTESLFTGHWESIYEQSSDYVINTQSFTSNVIASKLLSFNNNYDHGQYFDSGPATEGEE